MRPQLDRCVDHDPRSLDYPAPPAAPPTDVSALWRLHGKPLNQRALGSCGHAMAHLLRTEPFYRRSLDEGWPRLADGSSGLAVCKAARRVGLIGAYQHVFGLAHAREAILRGPFLVGTVWTDDMFTPDQAGFVYPAGRVVGGHEYLCVGYYWDTDEWVFLNSWGKKWGVRDRMVHAKHGVFYMQTRSFGYLLEQQGDIIQPDPTDIPL